MNGLVEGIAGLIQAGLAALGLGAPAPVGWDGYLEADYVYLAPVSPGRITAVAAGEGDSVAAGAVLARLDDQAQVAALAAAEAGVAQARANLDNLATGSRDAEMAVIAASLRRAEAERDLMQANLARSQALAGKGEASPVRVQQDAAALAGAEAAVEELRARLDVARLPARAAQRLAAEAALRLAEAQERAARIALADRTLLAPIAGRIDRRFFDAGEVAGAGAPILSIYDPAALKVVLFLPETARAGLPPGAILALTCDGCPPGLQARLTRIGAAPQFAPPILYSRQERGRLVFRAEAVVLGGAGDLTPGQPVTVAPLGAAAP